MNPLLYFVLVLKASLFSISGMGNVPSLHDDLIARGWATEQQFAEALSIGQLAPGPTGLWVVSLGYLMDGVRGAVLSLLAICVPPLFILPLERLYRRKRDHPAMAGAVRGLSLATVGIFVVVLLHLLRSTGLDVRSLTIAACSVGLGFLRRVPVFVVLILAGVAGGLWR